MIKITVSIDVSSLKQAETFYTEAFGWDYIDYGPSYAAFKNAGIDGGFDADTSRKPSKHGALVVLLEADLEGCLARVEAAGGKITIPIFAFPGGQRFHFEDPNGNDLAVWSIDEGGS